MITQLHIVFNFSNRMNQDRRLREKAARKKEKEAQQEEPSCPATKKQLDMLQKEMSNLTKMFKDVLALNEGNKIFQFSYYTWIYAKF